MIRRIATVGGLTLLSRVTGFARDVIMAAILGAGPLADAFFVAFRLPNHFRAIFAEGAFAAAFVPAYARTLEAAGMDAAKLRRRLRDARAKLLAVRAKRVRPNLDDKVLTGWNGLMIAGLAGAGRELKEPRYLRAAERAADFILARMRKDGRLLRSWREGQAKLNAYLVDYAFLADGLLELHRATGGQRWRDEAEALMKVLDEHFRDRAGGYFFTSDDHESLLARTKRPFDQAVPSGNAVAVGVLVRLGRLTGRKEYVQLAGGDLAAFAGCYSGPGIPAAAGCEFFDVDGDTDVDCADWPAFEHAYLMAHGTLPSFEPCTPPAAAGGSPCRSPSPARLPSDRCRSFCESPN
ncbi:hypothetical protein LCGC14_2818160 [marine sediment metagenome]|uniref:Uncharacterized protein n=1 Tax=marine sediment metagenome TaxID=412755 RepID=A0A0F9B952_9ZZZZ